MPFVLPLLLAAAAPVPTPTLSAAETPDARCMAAFAFMASKATGDQMELAKIGVFYFLGKLDSRHPGIDLEAAMREAAPLIANGYEAEVARCSGDIRIVASRLTIAGSALQKTP